MDSGSKKCGDEILSNNCFPEEQFNKPWETSGTLNHSWAYHALDFDWKSSEQLIKYLTNNASFGGNYQLNVGPTEKGEFQPAAIKRLRDIGNWMFINGKAIYETQASNLPQQSWGKITIQCKNNKYSNIYLHLHQFTPGNAILVDGLSDKPTDASIIETGQNLVFTSDDNGLWIELPMELKGLELPVIHLKFY